MQQLSPADADTPAAPHDAPDGTHGHEEDGSHASESPTHLTAAIGALALALLVGVGVSRRSSACRATANGTRASLSPRRGGLSPPAALTAAVRMGELLKPSGRSTRASDEDERQSLTGAESPRPSGPEWVIYYDRSGRPYWSDGTRSTWDKPESFRVASPGS